MIGERKRASEIVSVALRDAPFYKNSGGGLTLSGGEPTLQPDFCEAILRRCRAEDIHTAVETCGLAHWEVFERLAPHVCLWLYDVKVVDSEKHRELTGAPNDMILTNVRKLCERGAKLLVRLPLVPGMNDSAEDLRALAAFLEEIKPSEGVEILPYHQLGKGKYERLRKPYAMEGVAAPTRDAMESAVELVARSGVKATHG